MPHPSPDTYQIQSDGRAVWLTLDTGMTVARFGMQGIDVHTPQADGCLACTHGLTGPADWEKFQLLVEDHYDIVITDEHRPTTWGKPPDLSTQCGNCGAGMVPEHAHMRCPNCGMRDSCCDGGEQL